MNEYEKILDPLELNSVIEDMGTEIYALEDDCLAAKFKATDKLNELKGQFKTKAEAEWAWQATDEYKLFKMLEKNMRVKKSRRSDLKYRRSILMGKGHF